MALPSLAASVPDVNEIPQLDAFVWDFKVGNEVETILMPFVGKNVMEMPGSSHSFAGQEAAVRMVTTTHVFQAQSLHSVGGCQEAFFSAFFFFYYNVVPSKWRCARSSGCLKWRPLGRKENICDSNVSGCLSQTFFSLFCVLWLRLQHLERVIYVVVWKSLLMLC